jgi:hypothetical protein
MEYTSTIPIAPGLLFTIVNTTTGLEPATSEQRDSG